MTRPNIVFISSDDTNHEMLGLDDSGSAYTPRLRELAAGGVSATAFHAVSTVCTPSRYAWLTGHYAGRCPHPSFRQEIRPGEPYVITWNTAIDPARERTLGHLLQDAGYRTGWVGKCHTSGGGFGRLDDVPADADPADPTVAAALAWRYAQQRERVRATGFESVEALYMGNPDDHPLRALQVHNLPWLAHHALAFLDATRDDDRPFFLNLASTTLHGPHHIGDGLRADPRATPAGYRDEHLGCLPDADDVERRLAAAGVPLNHLSAGALWMDDMIGAVLDKLEELGIAGNTLVVYSADHGNHRLGKCFGKSTCYRAGAHIPFLARLPGVIPAGITTDALLQNVDLLPTCCALAGVDLPADLVCDGVDMLPALRDGAAPRERWYTEFGYARAIGDHRWQYIATRPPQRLVEAMAAGETELAYDILGKNGAGCMLQYRAYPHYWEPDQLYDLATDPDQQCNLVDDPACTGILADLRSDLARITASFDHPFPLDQVPGYLRSESYAELCAATTIARDPDEYDWYRRGAY